MTELSPADHARDALAETFQQHGDLSRPDYNTAEIVLSVLEREGIALGWHSDIPVSEEEFIP